MTIIIWRERGGKKKKAVSVGLVGVAKHGRVGGVATEAAVCWYWLSLVSVAHHTDCLSLIKVMKLAESVTNRLQ